MMLAETVNLTGTGPLKNFHMTEKDWQKLKIAGLLHDCRKVATLVHVIVIKLLNYILFLTKSIRLIHVLRY